LRMCLQHKQALPIALYLIGLHSIHYKILQIYLNPFVFWPIHSQFDSLQLLILAFGISPRQPLF
jgi:hypothetical protein